MTLYVIFISLMVGFWIGYALRAVLAAIWEARELREADQASAGARYTHDGPSAALSGPLVPDIDVDEPFADPDDDDAPDDDSEPREGTRAWAHKHLIRDTRDPRFWFEDNGRALRILGMTRAAPVDPREAEAAERARDWDQLLAELDAGAPWVRA